MQQLKQQEQDVKKETGSVADDILWKSFKEGNELALSVIYRKYVQYLYNYGMHSIRDHDLVKDCIQELFLRLWSTRNSLGDVQYVKPYLFKCFRSYIFQKALKKRDADRLAYNEEGFDFIPSIETVMIEEEAKSEQMVRLKRCIQALTKNQREVIFLKFYHSLSYVEIAEITELHVDSVYNLVSRTIQLLRQRLKPAKSITI